MAHVPTQERIEEVQKITQLAIDEKIKSQTKLGKEFILPKGGASGVIPEKIWKKIKAQS